MCSENCNKKLGIIWENAFSEGIVEVSFGVLGCGKLVNTETGEYVRQIRSGFEFHESSS